MNERYRQSVTISAKTVDEAIAMAERELGVPRDYLDITVITEGSRGFLGMRAENARILAVVIKNAPAQAPAVEPVPAGAPEPLHPEAEAPADLDYEAVDEEEADVSVPPGVRSQQQQETSLVAVEILETLLRHMDVRGRVAVRTVGNPIVLDISTENGGLLIGRHGDTLSALQYMVNVLVGKRTRGWTKIVVDVEHWRDRREETLRTLAFRQAERVRQQRRPISLVPMPANERRIIHMALQNLKDIETHSEGEEPHRHLIISLKR
jgi:spoIIIJ-associated protein